MALDNRIKYDLGITFRTTESGGQEVSKASLSLSPSGDIQLVKGRDKLAVQIARALISEAVQIPLNEYGVTERQLTTLVSLVLNQFKTRQVLDANKIDTSFLGFNIYRQKGPVNISLDTSDTYTKISKDPVTHKFLDTGLSNGFTYAYSISRSFRGGYEGPRLENIEVTPTQTSENRKPVIKKYVTGIPGDKSVAFYVDTNILYYESELLARVRQIIPTQDANDPRKWNIDVEIVTVRGDILSLSIGRQAQLS